ncbi:MAG: hypothetical protein ACK5Y6_04465 [Pseudomonadota bacterium]|jgi:hypothetical protein
MTRAIAYLAGALVLLINAQASATTNSCLAQESAVRYADQQQTAAERNLVRAQNSYFSAENQVANRTAQFQFRINQADANRQAINGANAGQAAGCAVRSFFRFGYGGCFAGAVGNTISRSAFANARYNAAVSQYNSYVAYSQGYLARMNSRVVAAQTAYDQAAARSRAAQQAYLECIKNAPKV